METSNRRDASYAPPTLHGQFVWYELMTPYPEDAKRFYGTVLGWATERFAGNPAMPYDMWVGPRGPLGGMMKLEPPAFPVGTPPSWMAYVAVESVDDSAQQVTRLGGRVLHGPEDIPEVGRFAVIQDPQGAVICLYRSTMGEWQPHRESLPGEFSWHELATTDPDAAWDFYSALFGWTQSGSFDMGDAGSYRLFGVEGRQLGGVYRSAPGQPPANWLLYVRIPEVRAAIERVQGAGGKMLYGPIEVPGGDQVAVCLDPQGAAFALHQVGAG